MNSKTVFFLVIAVGAVLFVAFATGYYAGNLNLREKAPASGTNVLKEQSNENAKIAAHEQLAHLRRVAANGCKDLRDCEAPMLIVISIARILTQANMNYRQADINPLEVTQLQEQAEKIITRQELAALRTAGQVTDPISKNWLENVCLRLQELNQGGANLTFEEIERYTTPLGSVKLCDIGGIGMEKSRKMLKEAGEELQKQAPKNFKPWELSPAPSD